MGKPSRPWRPRAGLFSLPPELRNRILMEAAMQHSTNTDGTQRVFDILRLTTGRGPLFRHFYANRQMLREMRTLFFGNNIFSLTAEVVKLDSLHLHRLPNGIIDAQATLRSSEQLSKLDRSDDIRKTLTHKTRITFGLNRPQIYNGLPFLTMLAPHPSVRRLIRLLQLHLEVPRYYPEIPTYAQVYSGDKTDWLYPVRAIKEIGFENLEKLEIFITYTANSVLTKADEDVVVTAENRHITTSQGSQLKEWVREQMAGMNLAGIEATLHMA
ncbi:hypothetical protein PRZ48_008897 [Zasmidium cellare]|uniref:Uncharacterized protein n=1 Tax=Zasmidium cellare TaxID=395010 RepID=A0ABR0EI08_ZASCE|nr:hypothetical protein PRZ48_008897 [Zasmidium cellare]